MKNMSVLKQLILITAFYLVFTLIEFLLDGWTGIHWTSPRDVTNWLGLIAIGLLWVWYFVDKLRKK